MSGQRVIVKRVELAGAAEGWDEDCYAYVRPASFTDMESVESLDMENMPAKDLIEFKETYVKDRFVSGKIKTFNGTDFELVDMTKDDAVASAVIANTVFLGIQGFTYDPKAVSEAPNETDSPTTNEQNSETSSSEESQSASRNESSGS